MSDPTAGEPRVAEVLQAVLDHAESGIFIEFDGSFAYVNAAAARLFGAGSAGDLVGRPVLERVPLLCRSLAAERMRHQSEQPQHTPLLEKQYLRLDGSLFEVEGSAIAVRHNGSTGTMVLFHEVALHGEVQAAERRTRALLHAVVEGTTDAIYVKDRDCRFLLVNAAACRMAGRTPTEILGGNDAAIFAPETAHAGMEHDRALMAGRTTETREEELVLSSGERITVLTTEGPVLDDAGEVIGLFGISRNITDRKRAEEERARLRAQLQHAQKLESVGRLAGGVAHDFNNLLTVINGYSDLLLAQLTSTDPMYDSVVEIRKAGKRAAALAGQLLGISRRQIVLSTVLDLNEVIVEFARMLARIIGEDIRLETDLCPTLGRAAADAGQLQQVLMNLAVNARDAMPSGGTLLIRTGNVELGEDYTQQHADVRPGAYVLMEVSDTGIGMSEDVRAHLFEPFFTTKKPGEGTGLGLATVYSIVKQTGGSIWTYSEPGKGTTFKIYLPRAGEEATPKTGTPRLSAATLRGTETILVVEDQESLRRIAKLVLTKYGYQVLEAGNAAEALVLAECHAHAIHLAVIDVVLSGMQGPELADRLKVLRPRIEIIFTSGYSEYTMIQRGILNRDAPFLSKPFSPEALVAKVREVLGPPPPLTILVVDDEAAIRGLARKVLTGAGYSVLEAPDGKRALQQIRNSKVDLVLTDLVMPEVEGLEMIRNIRHDWPETKIIAMSGAFGGQFLQAAELLGAQAILAKPIRPDDLLAAIRRVFAEGEL